jgi:hypothetical protein
MTYEQDQLAFLFQLKLHKVTTFVSGHPTEAVAQANDPTDIGRQQPVLEGHGKYPFLELCWTKSPHSRLTLEGAYPERALCAT